MSTFVNNSSCRTSCFFHVFISSDKFLASRCFCGNRVTECYKRLNHAPKAVTYNSNVLPKYSNTFIFSCVSNL
nr:MAG TPA: hypothetical protein [Caudoviricetes sp.]